MSSVLLSVLAVGGGMFTIVLGVVHLGIPSILRYADAIGEDHDRLALGRIALPGLPYELRRADLIGIAWVMSNAASYVLVTIGLIDLAWVGGWRSVPLQLGAAWIAGWWAIRSGGQLLVGRRIGDLAVGGAFAALAALHLVIAILEH